MGETVFTSLLMKNVLINSFNQEPKNKLGQTAKFFASCLSEKHFLYIHRIY